MRTIKIAIAGKGTVGRPFLRQFITARSRCRGAGIALTPVALCGRTHALIAPEGIPDEALGAAAAGAELRSMAGAVPHTGWPDLTARFADAGTEAVVDLTADENANAHAGWTGRGWKVASANKKPLTAGMDAWRRIMRNGAAAYGASATCGAGLPVIDTLSRLVASGDEVTEVRAMVSGTLGFLFSSCDGGSSFAAAMDEARRRGYTEPDPRDDLSGADCARKALIIARTLGQRIGLADVETEDLVPEQLRGGSAASFLSRLGPDVFASLDAQEAAAREDGAVLRYLITVTPDRAVARVERVAEGSPFRRITGPENMFAIRSARYDAMPITIAGPGAGGEVTAGAVLADLLRIVGPEPAHEKHHHHHYENA